ncbi:FMN-dependent NADH-azoreductase [Aestuariispira ectoiniformans]|uniref:FMN-dependent NADH-azoreductase n=1 Tax=Aestuariispira ectoiniformans TaxID=2775080 RepID=UPI00223AFEF3|nr:NAD(P)H-dependent oxidoreductase [Aestuariispira ectoiniformans]
MSKLLRIDASARVEGSLSRGLSRAFVDHWKEIDPAYKIMNRDVGLVAPPAMSEAWMAAAFTPEAARTREQEAELSLSDRLIEELDWAEVIVMATPMYNYGMPSALKAWLDHVVRINKTFTFDLARGDKPLRPILSGKTLVLLTASGEFGFGPGGINEEMNHLDTHIRAVSGYLGVEDIHHIGIEYQEFKDARHEQSFAKAHADVAALVDSLNQPDNETRAVA